MAGWTTPKTWASGYVVTAADLNTYMRDNQNYLKTHIALGAAVELTISSGAVTASQAHHTIDTEGDGASDDLDTISGTSAGEVYLFRAAHTDRTVVFKNGTGNLKLDGDYSLDDTNKAIILISDGTNLIELGRTQGGDHGALDGLGDDDHTIYLLADGSRTLTDDLAVTAGKKVDGLDISQLITIEHHTAGDTLTKEESGSFHTNLGAGDTIVLVLPQDAAGGEFFHFVVMVAQELRIDPGAAGAIYINSAKQTDDKYITADAINESLVLVADGNGDWIALYPVGTWGVEA